MRLGQIAAVLSAPLLLFAFSSNPPMGQSGAPGDSTCAGCHSPLTKGSGVTMSFPGGMTYTPGGGPVSVTVTGNGGSSGFELSARVSSNNTQAGSFTAGTNSAAGTSGAFQYIYHSNTASSWTFQWTPPGTNVGNVIMYVMGVTGGQTYSNSYTLTAASTPPTPTPTPTNTLSATPATLTFNYSAGTATKAQTISTSSSPAPVPFTTTVTTASGNNWLLATPPAGTTPMGVSVSINPMGLTAGAYSGTVTIASTGANGSPQAVNVTLNVASTPTPTPPPSMPTLLLSTNSMSYSWSAGAAMPSKNVQVTSSGSQLPFTAAVATTDGGNWLSASAMNGTTPATISISANPSGMTNGAYKGTVTFTASGASNNPQTLNVSMTVSPATPPPTPSPGTLTYTFSVLDKQSDGTDHLMLDGKGTSSSGHVTGGGNYTRFTIGSDGEHQTIAMGTWKATSYVSYSAASAGSNSGGVLEINVELDPAGGAPLTGAMRIANTGADKGVTLNIDGGTSFVASGTGSVYIGSGTGGYCMVPTGVRPPRQEIEVER